MVDKAWKADERAICEIFGSRRSGPVGRHGPDCLPELSHPYNIQIKRRKVVPKWLLTAMAQAQDDTRQSDRIATLVVHAHKTAIGESLVIFRLDDFARGFLKE